MAEDIVVEFDCKSQSLNALRGAAYRLIGTAACHIEQKQDRWVCLLEDANPRARGGTFDADTVRIQFLNVVADENLRESIAARTEPVRNVILALAFGALAAKNPTNDS